MLHLNGVHAAGRNCPTGLQLQELQGSADGAAVAHEGAGDDADVLWLSQDRHAAQA